MTIEDAKVLQVGDHVVHTNYHPPLYLVVVDPEITHTTSWPSIRVVTVGSRNTEPWLGWIQYLEFDYPRSIRYPQGI